MSAAHRMPSRRKRIVTTVLAVVFAGLGSTSIGVRSSFGQFWPIPVAVGVVLWVAAIVIQTVHLIQDTKAMNTVEALRIKFSGDFKGAFATVSELTAQLPPLDFAARAERLYGISASCASGLLALISPEVEELRVNVFTVTTEPTRMEWMAHLGRGTKPKPFLEGTARGDAAFRFLEAHTTAFYPDLGLDKPDGYQGSMSDYKTFISVPFWADMDVYGMVTIDAPTANTLTKGHQYLVEYAAELLAAAFAVANNEPEAS